MRSWDYRFDGEIVARVRRPDDELPYKGMPICIVGRSGKLAPAEAFVVASFDPVLRQIILEWQQ